MTTIILHIITTVITIAFTVTLTKSIVDNSWRKSIFHNEKIQDIKKENERLKDEQQQIAVALDIFLKEQERLFKNE